MSIQEEIHKTMKDIHERLKTNQNLSEDNLAELLLVALIEEEGDQ